MAFDRLELLIRKQLFFGKGWNVFEKRLGRKIKNGGEGEIRTRETLASLLAFQASGFNHSPTSPRKLERSKRATMKIMARKEVTLWI